MRRVPKRAAVRAFRAKAERPELRNMAEVRLVNIKKVYPFISGEQKKSKKKKADEPEKKKVNLQITDEGVVAVQEFNLDIKDRSGRPFRLRQVDDAAYGRRS